jgi:hypothetical protein
MAKGKKSCPKCNSELGVRTRVCSCGYTFVPGKSSNTTSVTKAVEQEEEVKGEEAAQEVLVVAEPENVQKRSKKIIYKGERLSADKLVAICHPYKISRNNAVITMLSPIIVSPEANDVLAFNSLYRKIEINLIEKSLSIWKIIGEGAPDIVCEGLVQ